MGMIAIDMNERAWRNVNGIRSKSNVAMHMVTAYLLPVFCNHYMMLCNSE